MQTVNGGGYTIDDQEQLEEKIDRLENEINRLKTDRETPDRSPDTPTGSQAGVSRRGFLKAVAGGAAGLGLTGMLPSAAALDIKSPHDLSYYGGGSTTPDFEVDTQGNLNLGGSNITNAGSIDTEELSGTYDTLVTSTSELEKVFNNLSGGETVRIAQPATPYRTTQWLDIDVDDVTIVAQSQYAEDGQALIKPADGADVGGIRVGTGATTVSDVALHGVGFDGNQATMTDTVKELHGIIVDNAENVTVSGGYLTRTHPYHEHNSGGSGVSVGPNSENCEINGLLVEDIGDRGIQLAGNSHFVWGNILRNGFDRCISLDMSVGGTFYSTDHSLIAFNDGSDSSNGSIIKGTKGRPRYNTIALNYCHGKMRGGIAATKGSQNLFFGNRVHQTAAADRDLGLLKLRGGNHSAVRNELVDETGSQTGVYVDGGDPEVKNNYIYTGSRNGISLRGSSAPPIIKGNYIVEFGNNGNANGIVADGVGEAIVTGNYAKTSQSARSFIYAGSSDTVYLRGNQFIGSVAPTQYYEINGSVPLAADNYPEYFALDSVATFAGGETQSFLIPTAAPADNIDVQAMPNADPNNDVGFSTDKIWWDDSAGAMKVQVSETEAAGGGDARIRADVTKAN